MALAFQFPVFDTNILIDLTMKLDAIEHDELIRKLIICFIELNYPNHVMIFFCVHSVTSKLFSDDVVKYQIVIV